MYIAEIIIKNNGGSFHSVFSTLEDVRQFAKMKGQAGDMLRILKNGDKLINAREIIIQ